MGNVPALSPERRRFMINLKFIRKSKICYILLLGLSLFLNCTWIAKPFQFDLKDVDFTQNEEMVLKIGVYNPNCFAIKVADVNYNIIIEKETLGAGLRPGQLYVRGRDTLITNFPLKINVLSILKTVPLFKQDSLVLQISGFCTLLAPIGKTKLNFKTEKSMPIKGKFESFINETFKKAK